jgi:transposase-like protein
MEEYPRNLTELEASFSTDEACRAYLARLRWPSGFACPRCPSRKSWPVRGLWECAGCGCRTSVTAGTIFQDTRTPLPVWFRAMWWVTSQKNGASALGLQRVLGLKSYETAWTWLHKLRRAMVRPGRDLLTGRIEVDETYLGGVEVGVLGRHIEGKALIAVAAQEDGQGIGRIRLRQIPDASAESLFAFLRENVQPGAVIHTDGWRGYSDAPAQGFVHEVTKLKKYMEPASELLPRVHRVISLLKRWLLGTHQGAVSHKHLDYYLDEFTFRFNRRKSKSRGKLFFRLAQQAVAVDPVTYDLIVHPPRKKVRNKPLHVGAT